ncbi:MAG TPA: hypothetical protein VMV65_10490 [Alphaproteobacteria bacterium]|nr:hypothetical protein [Alphaproteobacteria bacterium]
MAERTFRSLIRHALLYSLTAGVVIALEALVVFTWRANTITTATVASVIIEPFFVAIVTAFTYADVREDLSKAQVWLRVLERSWAVLVIGLLVNLVTALGLESVAIADPFQKLLGAGVMIVAISLIFADVHATVVDDAEPWWLLVPRSLGASMALAWQGLTIARAVIVFALQMLVPWILSFYVQSLLAARHVPQAPFWASAVSVLLLLAPVQAFCTYVYLDAIGYESKRSCSQ